VKKNFFFGGESYCSYTASPRLNLLVLLGFLFFSEEIHTYVHDMIDQSTFALAVISTMITNLSRFEKIVYCCEP